MNKHNKYIAKYFDDMFYYGTFIESPNSDKEINKFYDVMNVTTKNQLVELIWLLLCHIETNSLWYEFEEMFEEFREDVLEVYE